MEIGKLRHRVAIQQLQTTKGTHGGTVQSYAIMFYAWASINPVESIPQENFRDGLLEEIASHTIIIRYRNFINLNCRILFNSRIFNIVSIANLRERNKELHILVKELI